MGQHYDALREIAGKVFDLVAAEALGQWDQQTYLPAGAAAGRAHQLATLATAAHQLFTSDEFRAALEAAEGEVAGMDPDSDEQRVVWRLKRDLEKTGAVPSDWVERHTRATGLAFSTWKLAREQSDFAMFQPHLEEVVELKREYSSFFQPTDSPYDALLDDYEPGLTASRARALFDGLRAEQVPLVEAIVANADAVDDSFLRIDFDKQKQWDFGLDVIRDLGYDFSRGRQDKAPHPFSTSFNRDDVRITNRINPTFFGPGLFGSMHEAGHAMYSQGTPTALDRIPTLSGASLDSSHHASLGIHESQSRMMENIVGRSRGFWQAYYPRLQQVFPEQLGNIGLDDFYKGINKVERSYIRVEADEATYNLHIMLRFELEMDLFEGRVAVKDLPEAWNVKFEDYLGLTPPNDTLGVLQDIHWSDGYFGYFPTYTIGNLVAAQLWMLIERDVPDIEDQIAAGKFDDLLGWLRENVHRHGGKYAPMDMLERLTGNGLTTEPYLNYLKTKYGEIYGL